MALGEMISQFPIPGGQFALAGRFAAPELGFAMGWLFCEYANVLSVSYGVRVQLHRRPARRDFGCCGPHLILDPGGPT